MKGRPLRRSRLLAVLLGGALFLSVFLGALALSLPGHAIVSVVRGVFADRGFEVEARDARLLFPFGVHLANGTISPRRGGVAIPFDALAFRWEPSGLLGGLPGHLSAARGGISVDVRTSPLLWRPRRAVVRVRGLSAADLGGLLPPGSGVDFALEEARIDWKRNGGGAGEASLPRLTIPVPAAGSPVREATLQGVRARFTFREGTVHVSSVTGMYEGAEVDGTGEIAGIGTPAGSRITLHLKIRNPMEGRIAALFDLLAKNAKNANLRVTGSLAAPSADFEFF